jgi:hypothetical protein
VAGANAGIPLDPRAVLGTVPFDPFNPLNPVPLPWCE